MTIGKFDNYLVELDKIYWHSREINMMEIYTYFKKSQQLIVRIDLHTKAKLFLVTNICLQFFGQASNSLIPWQAGSDCSQPVKKSRR